MGIGSIGHDKHSGAAGFLCPVRGASDALLANDKKLVAAQRDILIVAQTGMPHGSLRARMGVALFFTQMRPKQEA
jgi:hypothetical protein